MEPPGADCLMSSPSSDHTIRKVWNQLPSTQILIRSELRPSEVATTKLAAITDQPSSSETSPDPRALTKFSGYSRTSNQICAAVAKQTQFTSSQLSNIKSCFYYLIFLSTPSLPYTLRTHARTRTHTHARTHVHALARTRTRTRTYTRQHEKSQLNSYCYLRISRAGFAKWAHQTSSSTGSISKEKRSWLLRTSMKEWFCQVSPEIPFCALPEAGTNSRSRKQKFSWMTSLKQSKKEE